MAKAASVKTRISTKGQVVLPKAIRDRRGWAPGAELIVEDRPDGVLLRAAPNVGATRFQDVAGSLGPVEPSHNGRGDASGSARRGGEALPQGGR